MHIISREPFNNATKQYPNEAAALEAIYKTLRRGEFRTPDELKALFPSLDRMKYKEKWWVIDVGGNHLRILFFASFPCPYCRAAVLSKTTGKRSNWWNICWKTMNTIR